MAIPACTLCDQEQGQLMATILMDGETVVVGGECLPGYALSMAASMTAGLSPKQCEAFGSLFDSIAANDSRPKTPPAPVAKRSPKRGTSAAAADGATGAPTGSADTANPASSEATLGDDGTETPDDPATGHPEPAQTASGDS